jgi:hypothetical protein
MMSAGRGRGGPALFRPPKPIDRASTASSNLPSTVKPVILALLPTSDDESSASGRLPASGSSRLAAVAGGGVSATARPLIGVVIHVGSDYGILVDGKLPSQLLCSYSPNILNEYARFRQQRFKALQISHERRANCWRAACSTYG